MRRHTTTTLAGTSLLIIGAAWLYAGPLDPPPGPITSTYKTLTEVEPRTAINATNTPGDAVNLFVISQPGSYYLAADIAGVSGKSGIGIAASNVTIDLNGFTMQGVTGSLSGIKNLGSFGDHTVRNGRVRDWDECGLELDGGAIGSTIESVETLFNGSDGMRLSAIANVRDCVSSNNGWHGFVSPSNAVLERCEARSNYDGISAGHGSTVSNCVARANSHTGIVVSDASTVESCLSVSNSDAGIRLNSFCTARACTVSANVADGIIARENCLVVGNLADRNGYGNGTGAGIYVGGNDCRIEDNNVTENDYGIRADVPGSLIIRNSASGNTSNYSIAAGNFTGTIVTSEAAMNSAPNANVNIAY